MRSDATNDSAASIPRAHKQLAMTDLVFENRDLCSIILANLDPNFMAFVALRATSRSFRVAADAYCNRRKQGVFENMWKYKLCPPSSEMRSVEFLGREARRHRVRRRVYLHLHNQLNAAEMQSEVEDTVASCRWRIYVRVTPCFLPRSSPRWNILIEAHLVSGTVNREGNFRLSWCFEDVHRRRSHSIPNTMVQHLDGKGIAKEGNVVICADRALRAFALRPREHGSAPFALLDAEQLRDAELLHGSQNGMAKHLMLEVMLEEW